MSKKNYRIRNWPEYNEALKNRYDITLWISDEALESWYAEPSGKRGAQKIYSDEAIRCCLTVRTLLRLPLRGCEGLLKSLLRQFSLDIPDYSTLSRRAKGLEIELPELKRGEGIHIAVDSSGVKVFGEGEWKVRMHGASKRRTWRKVHIGVNEATGEIVFGAVTTNDVSDAEMLPEMLEEADFSVSAVSCDGAYDKKNCYDSISLLGAEALIPPRRDARIWRHGNFKGEEHPRDKNLRMIRKVGKKRWKLESGYSRRSLAETAFSRIKKIFGNCLRSRLFENQATEVFIIFSILNIMTSLGMPDSYPVL